MTSFIDSGFTTKAEYEKSLAGGMSSMSVSSEPMTLGYWKIRGLAAATRMMFFYKSTSFKSVGYGEDAKDEWFGKDKPDLAKKNSMINLPYIVDGDTVVTQSNSCLVYLGQKLGIDKPECMVKNHQVLDQTMDLRSKRGTDSRAQQLAACTAHCLRALSAHSRGRSLPSVRASSHHPSLPQTTS